MTKLAELMQLDGALEAFTFSDRGELQQHTIADGSNLNETALDLLAHMCVANMSIATMQARGWEAVSGAQGFYPIEGFTLVGMDWSAVAAHGVGVVMSNDKADYELAYEKIGSGGGGE